jgi:hypothetical protein
MPSNSPLELDLSLLDKASLPTKWHESWGSPREALTQFIAQYMPHLNYWIVACHSTVRPLQDKRTLGEDWLVWLLGDAQRLKNWFLLIQCAFQARLSCVAAFCQSLSGLELFPYLCAQNDPRLLTLQRPAAPQGFDTFDEAIERLSLLLDGVWSPAQRLAKAKVLLARQDLADSIRQSWPELLPGQTALLDLVKFEPNLVHLVAFLIVFAQIKLGEKPLAFPLVQGDLYAAFLRAFAKTEELTPFGSLAIFDPRRVAPSWAEVATAIINPDDLLHFLQETPTVLSKADAAERLTIILTRTQCDFKLKRTLLRYVDSRVRELGLPWLVLSVKRARSNLFPELLQDRQ